MSTATENQPAVLVVGAGIAGMGASMHLAAAGQAVYLLDAAPAIGGSMHLLDHTFPTNSCGICLMLPQQPALCPTLECERQAGLALRPYAELVALHGEAGAFRAVVRHKPRYVDVARCTGCGACGAVCPEARPHDHEGWLAPVRAIYRPPGLRAVPDAWVIDMDYCTRCGACVAACPTGAVDLDMAAEEEELAVGAVLLAPGFAAFEARVKGEYGYGVYDNVLSALEFERMVSLAGSRGAALWRPGGAGAPRKVAFVHCVGSRDNLCGAGYCSAACCMYTAKQVALAKARAPELEVTVFHMDLRAMGKGYEAYLAEVQALPGVTYRRAMPSAVHEVPGSGALRVDYVGEDGRLAEAEFDLLVLAVGLAPPPGAQALATALGVELNEYGFAVSDGYHPARTTRAGVYVAGAFREPKDIPETVVEAAGAAAEVTAYLGGAAGDGAAARGAAAASGRDVSDEEPRVGVFVCECQGELAAVDPAGVAAWAAGQRGVAVAQVVAQGCTAAGRATIGAAVAAEGLNRVVVAGCSPRRYGDEFEAMMRDAELDPRLLARVNLREQVVYPHTGNGRGQSEARLRAKAQSLVGMAVAGQRAMAGTAALATGGRQAVTPRALVVGGGAAGLTAARTLAGLGVAVDLVERTAELGGQWRHIRHQADGSDPQAALAALVAAVAADERIRVHLEAEVAAVAGTAGAYRTTVSGPAGTETVAHGALVVATGGGPAATEEYLAGEDPRVLTQRQLEEQLAEGTLAVAQRVVMIQCVGSREPERPYCSRVCCTQAVKNALALKAQRPEVEVYVLYREVRTYGFREAYYQAARDAGVVFLRYEWPEKPVVSATPERLQVSVVEPVVGQKVRLNADLLVLSVGVEATAGTVAAELGVRRDEDGFYREEQAKMKPLDLGPAGVYVAGLAHSPRFVEETIAQAQGAAMRAAAFLGQGQLADRAAAVWVNERLCSFCGLCVDACPYGARVMDEDARVAVVDYALCQGCGVCAVVCPNKATRQKTFEHKQLMAALDMALV